MASDMAEKYGKELAKEYMKMSLDIGQILMRLEHERWEPLENKKSINASMIEIHKILEKI